MRFFLQAVFFGLVFGLVLKVLCPAERCSTMNFLNILQADTQYDQTETQLKIPAESQATNKHVIQSGILPESDPLTFDQNTSFAIMILSSRENESHRRIIRETWGKYTKNTFFVIGEKFCEIPKDLRQNWWECEPKFVADTTSMSKRLMIQLKERSVGSFNKNGSIPKIRKTTEPTSRAQSQHIQSQKFLQDRLLAEKQVLLVDTVDTYWNLTRKVLLSYKKLLKNLPNLKWVMKADDDAFVRTDKMHELIGKLDHTKPTVIGRLSHVRIVRRQRPDRYHDPNFLFPTYPVYPVGVATYILSRPIIEYLVKNMDSFPDYHIEDVALGKFLESSVFFENITWYNYERALRPRLKTSRFMPKCSHKLKWDGEEQKRPFHGLVFEDLTGSEILFCDKRLKHKLENSGKSIVFDDLTNLSKTVFGHFLERCDMAFLGKKSSKTNYNKLKTMGYAMLAIRCFSKR